MLQLTAELFSMSDEGQEPEDNKKPQNSEQSSGQSPELNILGKRSRKKRAASDDPIYSEGWTVESAPVFREEGPKEGEKADPVAPDALEDEENGGSDPKKIYPEVDSSLREHVRSLAEGDLDQLWEKADDFGDWIPEDDVPDTYECALLYSEEHELDPDKIDEIPEEKLEEFRQEWLDARLYGNGDADEVAGFAIAEVKDEGGAKGVAVIMRKGYSFSVLRTWLHAVYISEEAARADLEASGEVG